ncbi:putative PIN family toxin of toxin-antitoxin system [Rhabdobacter roseus]|uniref:Putative PIN family toxin of toxin-antitoxin system n=2 Tax=Rhabdobacter roseus TaxID=1655419 RepID=A0A840TWG6_9BACT|nr:putative PIN family toxin of toxin-antitoxin system [Rhabdobacter roseus]
MTKTNVQQIPKVVRDSDDDYLLGICTSCQADFLITGDQDLLTLKTYQETGLSHKNGK